MDSPLYADADLPAPTPIERARRAHQATGADPSDGAAWSRVQAMLTDVGDHDAAAWTLQLWLAAQEQPSPEQQAKELADRVSADVMARRDWRRLRRRHAAHVQRRRIAEFRVVIIGCGVARSRERRPGASRTRRIATRQASGDDPPPGPPSGRIRRSHEQWLGWEDA